MAEQNLDQLTKDFNEPQNDSAEINLDDLELPAPPEAANPGAAAYMEASAEAGGINLGQLDPPLPPDSAPTLLDSESSPLSQSAAGRADDGILTPPSLTPDESLSAPGPAPALSEESAAGIAGKKKRFNPELVKGFGQWLLKLWKSIPPLDDLFDKLLAALGFQRKPASMLKRANSLAAKGRLAEAIGWYRTLLGLKPLMVAAYDGLGRAYFRMGLTEEADREFTVADCLERLLHNRDDLEAAAHLAEALLEKRQAKMAVSLLEPILVAHFYTPHNSVLLKAMGKVYTELRANKKVFQVYAAGLAQYPNDYDYYLLKGDIDLKMGNIAEGEYLIRWGKAMKSVKANPSDPQAKTMLGELHIKDNKIEEGIKFLKEAAALMPDNVGLRWRLFNLYQKQGKFEESLKCFLAIVKIEPENEDLKYRLADFYRRNQRREQAVIIYRDLFDKHPRDPKPCALLGELLTEMGQFEEGTVMKELAITLECGLKKRPDHRETVRFMKYLFSINAVEEGVKWLERGLAQWPYHGELVLTKVKMLYQEFRYPEAITLLKRLIATKNDVAEPHIWIAMCYQRQGDNMAALAEAQLATRLAPKSFTAHKVLGDVLKEQKKLSQANAAYEVAEMMRQSTTGK